MEAGVGRKLTSKRALWFEHLRGWQASGERLGAYAAGHGLSQRAAYWWKAYLRDRGLFAEQPEACDRPSLMPQPPGRPWAPARDLKFIAARLARADDEHRRAQPGVRIHFPNGIVLEVGRSCLGALDTDLATRLAAL